MPRWRAGRICSGAFTPTSPTCRYHPAPASWGPAASWRGSEVSNAVASTIDGIGRSLDTLIWYVTRSPYATGRFDPEACDFCFGNPHEMPLPEIAEALTRWAVPRAETWF